MALALVHQAREATFSVVIQRSRPAGPLRFFHGRCCTRAGPVAQSRSIATTWSSPMIDVYSWPTPNGHKVHIMLEECGLPYEAHKVDIQAGEQMTPEFLSLNPNNKIPAIIDPQGANGQAVGLFESGAILIYLAEKTGKFWVIDSICFLVSVYLFIVIYTNESIVDKSLSFYCPLRPFYRTSIFSGSTFFYIFIWLKSGLLYILFSLFCSQINYNKARSGHCINILYICSGQYVSLKVPS